MIFHKRASFIVFGRRIELTRIGLSFDPIEQRTKTENFNKTQQ